MRQRNSYSRIIWDLELWEQKPKGAKIQLFHHCVEKDITSFYIDTSEFTISPKDALGTALSESGLSRDEIQLIGGIREENPNAEKIISKVEELLNNLKTDYLDLLLIDFSSSPKEIKSALEQLKSQGKITETGLLKKDFRKQEEVDDISIQATLAPWKYSPASVKMLSLERAPAENITEMLFLELEAPGEKTVEAAKKYQLSGKEFVLAWLLQHPAHFHPILKGGEQEEIDAAVKAFHTTLIREDREKFPKQL